MKKERQMKNKIFTLLTATLFLTTLSSGAYALKGFLDSQSTEGQWRYCKYSNGKVITIAVTKICPLSID